MDHRHHMRRPGTHRGVPDIHHGHGHIHRHPGHVYPTDRAHHMDHVTHLEQATRIHHVEEETRMHRVEQATPMHYVEQATRIEQEDILGRVVQSCLSDQMSQDSHVDHGLDHSSNATHIQHAGHVDHTTHMHHMGHSGHVKSFSLFTESDFILEGINIISVKGIILAMLVATVIAVIYEALNTLQHIREHQLATQIIKSHSRSKSILEHGISTLIRLAAASLAYLMMLCVMTMNVWLFLSIIVGSGLGHLFVRPILSKRIQIAIETKSSNDIEVTLLETQPLSDHGIDHDETKLSAMEHENKDMDKVVKVDVERPLLT